MKRAALGVAFLAQVLVWGQPAAAQPAATTPTASAEAGLDAHKLALARQLVQATRMDTTMTGAFHGMAEQVMASVSKNLPADRQEKMKVIGEAEGNALAKLVPQIVNNMVDGYARNFTEQELSDMLAFYQSPSGRSMVAKTPQFMRGIATEMAQLMPQIRHDMGDEVCAKTACTAAERAAYFGDGSTPAKAPGTPPAP